MAAIEKERRLPMAESKLRLGVDSDGIGGYNNRYWKGKHEKRPWWLRLERRKPIELPRLSTDWEDIPDAVVLLRRTLGLPHLTPLGEPQNGDLFNNAATLDPRKSKITDNEAADFNRVLDVNVQGAFLGTKHAARVMIPAQRGSIINNGSVASVIGGVASHAYVASKHALVGLTKSTAAELGHFGIRVNCISPFLIVSSLIKSYAKMDPEEINRRMRGLTNLHGVALKEEDVALAAVYFGSDESGYVSGQNFLIDGGFSAVNHAFGLFNQNLEVGQQVGQAP